MEELYSLIGESSSNFGLIEVQVDQFRASCHFLILPSLSLFRLRFIDWTHEVLSSSKDDVMGHFQLIGVVEALAAIFKVFLFLVFS